MHYDSKTVDKLVSKPNKKKCRSNFNNVKWKKFVVYSITLVLHICH